MFDNYRHALHFGKRPPPVHSPNGYAAFFAWRPRFVSILLRGGTDPMQGLTNSVDLFGRKHGGEARFPSEPFKGHSMLHTLAVSPNDFSGLRLLLRPDAWSLQTGDPKIAKEEIDAQGHSTQT